MARLAKISSGILNIRLHPHSAEKYAEFITAIYKRKRPARVHGDRFGMISSFDTERQADGWISGVITTFTSIDPNGKWFDENVLEEATEEQKSSIKIPKNLHPNSASFYFQFDLGHHRLYLQTYSKGKTLSIHSGRNLFVELAAAPKVLEKFGEAKIDIVQSKVGLARIFALKTIKETKITLQKPNADIFSDNLENKIERHLEETHSRKVVVTYEAEKGQSIVATDSLKAVSTAALDHGSVEGKGNDGTGTVTISTQQFPRILQEKYDPNVQTEEQAFRSVIPNQVAE